MHLVIFKGRENILFSNVTIYIFSFRISESRNGTYPKGKWEMQT